MKWYEFYQNNSGGRDKFDFSIGLGKIVWIEALSATDANRKAQAMGIYFDGVESGMDCECCGDRWDRASDSEAVDEPSDPDSDVFLHYADGRIELFVD